MFAEIRRSFNLSPTAKLTKFLFSVAFAGVVVMPTMMHVALTYGDLLYTTITCRV